MGRGGRWSRRRIKEVKETAASRPGTARGGVEKQSLTERSSILGQIVLRKPIAARSAVDPSLWRLSTMSDRWLIGYGRSNCLDQIVMSTNRASFI